MGGSRRSGSGGARAPAWRLTTPRGCSRRRASSATTSSALSRRGIRRVNRALI
jgi:hypothetical protein